MFPTRQAVPGDLVPVSDAAAARAARVSQRQDARRCKARSVRAVRDRGEGPAEGGARVREPLDQRHGRRRAQPGRVAQCHGKLRTTAHDGYGSREEKTIYT